MEAWIVVTGLQSKCVNGTRLSCDVTMPFARSSWCRCLVVDICLCCLNTTVNMYYKSIYVPGKAGNMFLSGIDMLVSARNTVHWR
jgi:hypothetical protein